MPPFVYRSLKDYMRTATMGSARQELLKKLLAQAAQRKTQLHIDASGARMNTFPEMFGQSLAKNMGKQAFLGAGLNMAGRGIANFAGKQLQGGLGRAVGGLGNAVRGVGIQAQRAGQRIGTAAQPLVNELKNMGGQIMSRGAQTAKNLPGWAMPAAGGAAVGAAGMHDYHALRDLGQSRLPQTMPQMPGGFNNRPKFETLPYKMPRPNGIIPGGMNMPQYQNHRADGFNMPNPARQQGGLMMGNDPYSMSLAKASADKQANMALLKQMLSPALKQLRSAGSNAMAGARNGASRYMELLSGNKLKGMAHKYDHLMEMFGDYPTKALTDAHGPIGYDVAANANGVLTDLQHNALSEAAKVIGTRTGTVGAGLLGGSALINGMQNEKTSGLMDEVLRRAASGVKGVVTGHGGQLLEAMTPKAQGFKRYLEMLRFQRVRAMRDNAEKLMKLHPSASNDFAEQMSEAYLPELYKSVGTGAGTGVGGMLGLNALFSGNQPQQPAMKQSAEMPEPSSRGQTKKVTMPEAPESDPDCDPEGADMTEKDHDVKEAGLERLGTHLLRDLPKLLSKAPGAIYGGVERGLNRYGDLLGGHTRENLRRAMFSKARELEDELGSLAPSVVRMPGVGWKMLEHEVGPSRPLFDAVRALNKEEAKNTLTRGGSIAAAYTPAVIAATQQKQAFMGPGAIAGLLTAPKGQSDLSVGRGALRGLGTGLGVGTGAITGGLLGGGGGAAAGGLVAALAAALSGQKGRSFNNAVGQGITAGGGLGMLAGGVGGAAYGGYKGNKATKALLDKTAPIDEDDADEDDDKDVKKSAAAVLAQLKKNQL